MKPKSNKYKCVKCDQYFTSKDEFNEHDCPMEDDYDLEDQDE